MARTMISSTLTINCAAGVSNGTQAQPITIRAENERKAHLHSTSGRGILRVQNCGWCVFDGLYVSNTPSAVSGVGDNITFENVTDSTLRRILNNQQNWGSSCPLTGTF